MGGGSQSRSSREYHLSELNGYSNVLPFTLFPFSGWLGNEWLGNPLFRTDAWMASARTRRQCREGSTLEDTG